MDIKKTIHIRVIGNGNIPISLEGVQLAIENSERLFNDSNNVSTPTKFALLEIGLEEIAKAWGIILAYESDNFRDHNFGKTFIKKVHISKKKFDSYISKINEDYKTDINWFMKPFDTNTFSQHNKKIEFLSKFIEYIRHTQLPLIRATSDRDKMIRELFGRYISKDKLLNLKDSDKIIDNILNVVDTKQFNDILELKENGLYLDVQNDVFISPSSRSFETETLENLLEILIIMAKNEITLILATLKDMKKVVIKAVKTN